MKNPFRRQPNEIDRQLAALRDIAETMQDAADRVAIETSPPMLKKKLAELDPRLMDLLIDRAGYDILVGGDGAGTNQRVRAVKASRVAMRDVQVKAAVRTWTAWGFGRSLDIKATDEAADEVWQECWKAARNRALFGQAVIHETSRDLLRDGELFFVGYASRVDGTMTWRTFDTLMVQEIIHPENDDSVNLWYIVKLDDKQVAIPDAFSYFSLADAFQRAKLPQGVPDINDTPDALENGGTFTVIVPALRNRDEHGRGWPEFHDAIPWGKVYEQMLREYSAVFSTVAMHVDKLKVRGGSQTVTDIITQLQSSLVTGNSLDRNPPAAAGSTWVQNEALDRERMPLGTAAGDAQAGTGILAQQLAAALGVKTSDVGRVDMFQNRATSIEAGRGPQQLWQQYQLFWASAWHDIVETTLRVYALFNKTQFSTYESAVATSLPMDIDTADVVAVMKAVNEAAAAMTLDFALANRAQEQLLALALADLGVEDISAILEPEPPTAAAEVALGESHTPVVVRHVCPLCGHGEANHYEGHGALLVCAGCSKTYDPEVE